MTNDLIPIVYTMRDELGDYCAVRFELSISPFYVGLKWAVRRLGECLSVGGEWEYEPLPSSRDAAFYDRCRFMSLDAAVSAYMAAKQEKAKP